MSGHNQVFTYRVRRDDDNESSIALAGTTIALMEAVEYVLEFQATPSIEEQARLIDLGGELLRHDVAVVSFGNFVGHTSLCGVNIKVRSGKISQEGVSLILEEISVLSAALVFGWRSLAHIPVQPMDNTRLRPVPYHQLQLLRHAILDASPGQRFQDWFHVIERSPTRRFAPERSLTSVDRVRRIDQQSLRSILSRIDRLVPVQDDAPIADSRLAQKLVLGTPPIPHFPVRVDSPRGRLSFDTPENRFIRHAICECLGIIYRFVDHPRLHSGLGSDCRMMLSLLEPLASATYVAEATPLLTFRGPSQALAKMDGYREVFHFWNRLTSYVALPTNRTETTRLLEGRDMATLYEYWTFLKILEGVCNITRSNPAKRPIIRRDELGERLSLGMVTTLRPDLEIGFNMTFRRNNRTAYSTPLRPDVTLRVGETLHVFDAKYRLERLDAGEIDPDDDSATYKRADLYKMHTYRDSISGLATAFIVYPGTDFVFFERAGNVRTQPARVVNLDGVGAVPLRPSDHDPAAWLRDLLRTMLTVP